jgi:hypothetical protein
MAMTSPVQQLATAQRSVPPKPGDAVAPARVRYATLFDSRYLSRGLAMLASLQPFMRAEDEIVVLAMDDPAERALDALRQRNWRVVRLPALDDAELLASEATRGRREFIWTCTPAFSRWLMRTSSDGEMVVYLDADLLFFADPRSLLDELADDGNILIHEHRFSAERAGWEATAGRFNVGMIGFRVGAEAGACVERWRAQTIERCELDPKNGYCADQGYLNEWPSLYPGVRIMRNIGGGVAPWNVNRYRVEQRDRSPTVDDRPVVFFHYHALERLIEPRFGFIAVCPSLGYSFPRETLKAFYRPYARSIRRIEKDLLAKGYDSEGDRVRHWLDIMIGLVRGRYVSAM